MTSCLFIIRFRYIAWKEMMALRMMKLTADGNTEKKEKATSQSGSEFESVTGFAWNMFLIQNAKITNGTKNNVAGCRVLKKRIIGDKSIEL